MAIEDVYVLRELLASPKCTRDTIPEFLQAYEAVRRPRASKQQLHSRESGEVSLRICRSRRIRLSSVIHPQIYELASPLGSDFRALAEAVPGRYDWIWMHDISLDVEKAKGLLQSKGLVD
jgi:salicylate hydroxylase